MLGEHDRKIRTRQARRAPLAGNARAMVVMILPFGPRSLIQLPAMSDDV